MENGILHLVGVDTRNPERLPTELLENCSALVMSARFTELLKPILPGMNDKEIIPIAPLKKSFEVIAKKLREGDVAVIASGDPMFFGIGKKLVYEFGAEVVDIHPALSSIQYAFATYGVSWDDASFLSLHGRTNDTYVGSILAAPKTVILTDGVNRPEVIAQELLSFLGDTDTSFTAYVAENIGMQSERFVSGSLQHIAQHFFESLCCMIIVRNTGNSDITPGFGLYEKDIIHSRGLITKSEVRAAAIHALQIPANAIVWDVGAGSGSVGLEIARMNKNTLVYSIEKNTEQHINIEKNKKKYDVLNLKVIKGEAPEQLLGLPAPHRVFIGGSGGNLHEIIDYCNQRLLSGGRIVVTGVLEKTCNEAPAVMHDRGLVVETSRMEVTRTRFSDQTTTTFNPITIIIGKKI